jgi:hypothetical protein
MCGIRPVREPYEGCLSMRVCFGTTVRRGKSQTDRYFGAPVPVVSDHHRREACGRSPGEVLGKVCDENPGRVKTQGSIRRWAN